MKECECASKRVHYQCSFSFWKTPVFQYSVQEFASSHQLHDHEHVFTIIINLANRTIMIHELNVCNSKEVHHLFFLQIVQDSRQSLSGYQSTRKPKRRRWSTIVLVNKLLNRTVVDSDWRFNNLCGGNLQSQSESYHISWWHSTLVIDLIPSTDMI